MFSKIMEVPRSCDTFVVMPQLTQSGSVVFGKNSDRPRGEIQEVVYIKGCIRPDKLKCTYITIDESANPLNDVILSKPAWMWGAEMGSNDKGVCIGNEAVWTNYNDDDGDATQKRLLGMDLVRLGLERGNTAEEALNIITSLLEKYGQGGPCSENESNRLVYHNSFIIADPREAWVLETSGKFWVAEKVDTGYRNISNNLTITTKIDKHSKGLQEKARSLGLWKGEGEFNFTEIFSSGGNNERQTEGSKLLKNLTKSASFTVKDMFTILRNKDSGICRACDDSFPTQGSQVSIVSESVPSVHWFTATPDPSTSVFKPFVFTPNVKISTHTISPNNEVSREHSLYKLHAQHYAKSNSEEVQKLLHRMEADCVDDVIGFLEKFTSGKASIHELDELMKDCVEAEIKLYR